MKKILSTILILITTLLYSQNSNETLGTNEGKEFENAMNSMTVEAMDHFITLHSDSKLKDKATEIRDSLALPKMGSGYYEFLEYVNNYPNSKYSFVIKKDLPQILYRDATLQSSFHSAIELFKLLITIYPNDPLIKNVKNDLEMYYVLSLNKKFNIDEYKEYKSFFPESRYYLDKTTKKMRARSDGKYSNIAEKGTY